jgi:S-adenosylmethionine hydrolase
MLLSAVEEQSDIEYYLLDREEYWRHPVSNTFHGRDIFASVAGHLARGVRPEELGSPASQIESLGLPATRTEGDKTFGVVIHIDHFGNLITNIRIDNSFQNIEVTISGRTVRGLSTAYAESRGLLVIVGSHGYLEIAWNRDSAAQLTGAKFGAPVVVRRIQL